MLQLVSKTLAFGLFLCYLRYLLVELDYCPSLVSPHRLRRHLLKYAFSTLEIFILSRTEDGPFGQAPDGP